MSLYIDKGTKGMDCKRLNAMIKFKWTVAAKTSTSQEFTSKIEIKLGAQVVEWLECMPYTKPTPLSPVSCLSTVK